MKSKKHNPVFEDSATSVISFLDARFKEYPQLEAIVLEGVTMACSRVCDFLNEVQAQIDSRAAELRSGSKGTRRYKSRAQADTTQLTN